MFGRKYTSAILATLGVLIIGAIQFQAQTRPKVRPIQHIKDNLYWISGGDLSDRPTWTGGNTGVFVTQQGAVVIDAMLPNNGAGIIEQVKSITDKPIIMI